MSVGGLFACMAICVGAFYVNAAIYCHQRRSPPNVPIYPGSILSDSSFDGVGGDDYSGWRIDVPRTSLATYYYLTSDQPDKVLEYYRKITWTPANPKDHTLRGDAEPFGDYFISVRDERVQNNQYEYFIEIFWNRC
ncbi:MAG: hypothetical protein ABI690_12805 [Chloroflexota bacterium]